MTQEAEKVPAADAGPVVERGVRAPHPKRDRPTRADLLLVIERLQGLIGQAQGAAQNDRAPDRADRIQPPLTEAFSLCVAARSFDPPPRHKRPNVRANRTKEAQ